MCQRFSIENFIIDFFVLFLFQSHLPVDIELPIESIDGFVIFNVRHVISRNSVDVRNGNDRSIMENPI